MRTTLDLADDVLADVKERARREGRTAGEVASDLLRTALTGTARGTNPVMCEPKPVYGFMPFGRRGAIVTDGLVDQLRTEDAY